MLALVLLAKIKSCVHVLSGYQQQAMPSSPKKGKKSAVIDHLSKLQSLLGSGSSSDGSTKRPRSPSKSAAEMMVNGDTEEANFRERQQSALGRLSPLGGAKGKRYGNGDLFGTRGDYLQGMIYKSRGGGNVSTMKALRNGSSTKGITRLAKLARGGVPLSNVEIVNKRKKEDNNGDFIEVCWKTVFRAKIKAQKSDLHSLQEAASALRNIVDNPELHPLLLKDGIISGIKALLERTRDPEVVRSCCDALCTLAHNTNIQALLVDEGLIEMLIYFMRGSAHLKKLAPRGAHTDILCNCAQSFLAVSANAGPLQTQLQVSSALENRLVREGPLSELQHLQSKDPSIRWALLKMIFNLAALGDHLPCVWLEDIIRIAMDTLQNSIKIIQRIQRHQKAGRAGTPTTTGEKQDAQESEFYAVILLMQTISRLARITGVTQALLAKDIIHSISAVVAIAYECLLTKPSNQLPELAKQKKESVEFLELSCILLYYLSGTVKAAPRMIEAQCHAVLRDLWGKLLAIRSSPFAAELKFAAASMELTTITVAVLGNLARNPFARTTLIEKGLTAELAVLAQEHTVHLQMRRSGIEAISASADSSKAGMDHEDIDPVLSEKLLATAVAALEEIACDDVSACVIAQQGALRMLNVVATYASDIALRAKAIVTICNMLSSGDIATLMSTVEDDMVAALDVLVLLHQEIVHYDLSKSGFIVTALHNLSCVEPGRLMMQNVGEGILQSVTWIAKQQEDQPHYIADPIVVLCAGTLFNLSSVKVSARLLMHRRWIRSVIDIMKQSRMSRVDELCIATLYNLSKGYEKAGRAYAGEGALEELIELTNNDEEPNAQALALTTLCILTTEADNVSAMVRRGLIKALVAASYSHSLAETATIGLNNLSMYDHGKLIGQLIEEGAVDILIDHVANKDPAIRGNSVITVCHLACCCSTTLKPELGNHCLAMMLRHGAVEALLLAGFVRSSEDSKATQEACCKGLYALLASAARNGSTEQLATWQVVRAAVTMLESGNHIRDIATILLVNISVLDEGRSLFTSMGFDHLNEVALSKVSPPPTIEVRKRIVKILHNMLHKVDPMTIPKEVVDSDDEEDVNFNYFSSSPEEGKEGETKEGATVYDPNSMEAMESQQEEARALAGRCKRIARANGVSTLMSLCRIEDPDCRLMCAVALSTIANNESTHVRFVKDGGFRAMTEMAHYDRTDVGTSACWSIRLCCIRTAAYAARVPGSRLQCVVDGACEMIVQAVQSTVFNDSIKHLCCQTIELFSRERTSRPHMARQGIVEALDHLLAMASAGHHDSEAILFARTVRNLSYSDNDTVDMLVDDGIVNLFHSFATFEIESVATDCSIAICNVFQKTSQQEALINDGALSVIQSVLSHGGKDPFSPYAEEIRESCAACILSMAIQEHSREFLLREGMFQTIHQICTQGNPTDATIDACCRALCVFCLDPTIRPLVVRLQAHQQVVGLHTIFARLSKRRSGPRGVLQISQSRLALALLNLARVGATETQSDIIQHCDASALLEQASSLTDHERDAVSQPVIIDVRSNNYAKDLIDSDHVDDIPEIYSFVREEPWQTFSFKTELLQASGMESHETPELAPRWKADSAAVAAAAAAANEANAEAVNSPQSPSKSSPGRRARADSGVSLTGDSERRKQSEPIVVQSVMMERLLERLNCSYGSTVSTLRYSVPSKIVGESFSIDSSTFLGTESSMTSSSLMSESIMTQDEEDLTTVDIGSLITSGLMDSSIVINNEEDAAGGKQSDLGNAQSEMSEEVVSPASQSQVVPKIAELLGEEIEEQPIIERADDQQERLLVAQMRHLFQLLDNDNSNFVDKIELLDGIMYRSDVVAIMQTHPKLALLLAPGTFEESFSTLDTEKDGHVTLEELLNFVHVHHDKRTKEEMQQEKKLHEKNKSTTTEEELASLSGEPTILDTGSHKDKVVPPLSLVEENKTSRSHVRPRLEIRNGRVDAPDQHQRSTANKFLMAMRARSTESAHSAQRKLVTGLCASLTMLSPSRGRSNLDEDSTGEQRSSAFSQVTPTPASDREARFPPVKTASPRQQTTPASPKMSRISFSR